MQSVTEAAVFAGCLARPFDLDRREAHAVPFLERLIRRDRLAVAGSKYVEHKKVDWPPEYRKANPKEEKLPTVKGLLDEFPDLHVSYAIPYGNTGHSGCLHNRTLQSHLVHPAGQRRPLVCSTPNMRPG